jgi:N-acetylglutamate synthase-like GNAT family acetyltransferase
MTIAKSESEAAFRPATLADVPRMAGLIAAADLPPIFIEEFIDGFLAADVAGQVGACGGVELYDDCAVIRSVVVDPSARGLGLGGQLAERLIALARARGARDIYLFTMDAWEFWKHYGFTDVALDAWKGPARACWQYQFISQNAEMAAGIHTMWLPVGK